MPYLPGFVWVSVNETEEMTEYRICLSVAGLHFYAHPLKPSSSITSMIWGLSWLPVGVN